MRVLILSVAPVRSAGLSALRAGLCMLGLLPLLSIAPAPTDASPEVATLTNVSFDVVSMNQAVDIGQIAEARQVAGDWNRALQTHFADGGVFDQLYDVR
jgi:ABC-type sulfate transport system substrate-binding protein